MRMAFTQVAVVRMLLLRRSTACCAHAGRHVALGELRFFLTDQRAFMCELVQRGCSGRTAVGAGMSPESSRAVTTAGTTQKLGKRAAGAAGIKSQSSAGAAADAALLAQLLSALLRCCENTVRTRLGKDIRIRWGGYTVAAWQSTTLHMHL